MIKGSCLCAAVTWESDAPADHFVLCHCNRCKKASGSAFSAGMAVAGLRFLSGEDLVNCYEAPLLVVPPPYRRDFCSRCGTPVPSPAAEPGIHVVRAGSLDDDPGVAPKEHVWVNCEAPWEQAIHTLPRLTEAQFVLDRIQRTQPDTEIDLMRARYQWIIERYADKPADAPVVQAARRRLAELGSGERGIRPENDEAS
jgi:hypothetical protein